MEKTYDTSINLNLLDEKGVYEAFHVDGNEVEALTDSYFELYRLLGTEAMLKLYKHYHGDIFRAIELHRAVYLVAVVVVVELHHSISAEQFIKFKVPVGKRLFFILLRENCFKIV